MDERKDVAEAMNTSQVYAEVSEGGDKIQIFFRVDREKVAKMKKIMGYRFVNRDKAAKKGFDQAYWEVPLDLQVGAQLREQFGDELVLGEKLIKWGKKEKKTHAKLDSLSKKEDTELEVLPKKLPKLNKFLRPYQKVGAAFAATAPNPLIADQPGLGKTVQAIAALFEAGTVDGPNLVVAPKVSLETVWARELRKHQPHKVFVATGNRDAREDVLSEFYVDCVLDGKTGFLIINPQMAALRRIPNPDYNPGSMDPDKGKWLLDDDGNAVAIPAYNMVGDVTWSNIILDECHKNAVRNANTFTARGLNSLTIKEGGKKIALSGTPMDKPIHLWGILHWLHPEKFRSKWKWADQWLEVNHNGWGLDIGRIKPGLAKEFYRSLDPYIIRRIKSDVFKELPPIQFEEIWVEMEKEQQQQYEEFKKAAIIRFEEMEEEGGFVATNILTELLRAKQIAIAKQTITEEVIKGEKKIRLVPTIDSAKLAAVEQLLDERGIIDEEGKDKVVIYSQFTTVVRMLEQWLKKKKVKYVTLTGDTSDAQRPLLQDEFQKEDGPRVMLMQTSAGISITLDRADTCIFMDEMWNPSDHEQAWDRLRGGIPSNIRDKDQQVTCYFLRTKGTIDEKIMLMVKDKANVTREILDDRRYMEIL